MEDLRASDPFDRAVDVEWGISYRETPERDLLIDYYQPDGSAQTGLVFVHGGGWSGGGRDHFARQAAVLSTLGYACASIEYRLSDEATYPAAVADVAAAVEWMEARGVEQIGLLGGSAGGHLAALIALAPGIVDADVSVDTMVLFNPVLDLVSYKPRAFLGTDYERDPGRYEEASPITYVSDNGDRSRAVTPQTPPPTLISHGTDDETAPFEISEQFCEDIRDAGIRADLFTAPGATHAFFNYTPWYERTLCETIAFLRSTCPP